MSGFFGALLDGVSGIPVSSIINAAGSIGSALIGADANKTAATTAAAGNQQAASTVATANTDATSQVLAAQEQARQELEAAKARGIGDIDQGTADYTATTAPLLTQPAITLPQYRGLTQQQQIGEADLMRNGQAALAASGLRGAGRAGVATLLDADSRYQAGARSSNDADTISALRAAQTSQNTARSNLGQVQAGAGTVKANTEIGAGSSEAQSLQSGGQAQAALTAGTGSTTAALQQQTAGTAAASGLATAKTDASTLGTLGSVVATGSGTPNSPVATIGSLAGSGTPNDPNDAGGTTKTFTDPSSTDWQDA